MASSREYLDFIMEQLSPLGDIGCRAMMGEYIIYYHGRLTGAIRTRPKRRLSGIFSFLVLALCL